MEIKQTAAQLCQGWFETSICGGYIESRYLRHVLVIVMAISESAWRELQRWAVCPVRFPYLSLPGCAWRSNMSWVKGLELQVLFARLADVCCRGCSPCFKDRISLRELLARVTSRYTAPAVSFALLSSFVLLDVRPCQVCILQSCISKTSWVRSALLVIL